MRRRAGPPREELTDYFAIGQCTPGIIAVNTATFVGHKYRGVSGGVVATPGPGVPFPHHHHPHRRVSQQLRRLPLVQHALGGINACVVALIAVSVLEAGKEHPEKRPRRVHFSGGSGPGGGGQPAASGPRLPVGAALGFLSSPAILVVLAGVTGWLLSLLRPGKEGGEGR